MKYVSVDPQQAILSINRTDSTLETGTSLEFTCSTASTGGTFIYQFWNGVSKEYEGDLDTYTIDALVTGNIGFRHDYWN